MLFGTTPNDNWQCSSPCRYTYPVP
jgi:hypothetical protein